jgi:NADPH-dependent 2,4-dienoyl-CoA reductase/sulfur reductase-like enzyme
MNVVVIGAGPAGIRAAGTLAASGLRPVLLDEAPRPGGQGYRSPAPGIGLDSRAVMGSQFGKFERLHTDFAYLRDRIDHRPGSLVWAIDGRELHILADGRALILPFDALVIASGATDRIMPLPGWTLPGVFSLGGAQIALKDQGCLIGRRVAFCGSSPLLALAAVQYASLGAEIVAVCDTTSLARKIAAAPGLMAAPATLARGLGYLARLRRAGIPLLFGCLPHRIEGEDRVEALVVTDDAGRERRFPCDAVALGHGLKPETQLAELAGAAFAFDDVFRLWLPRIDPDGRAGPGLYLAGDGAAIGGADAAEISGELAALALLSDMAKPVAQDRMARLRRRLGRLRRFQRALAGAFAWPYRQAASLPDATMLCRCEGVTVGEVRASLDADLIPPELNRVKAITRCGMGRCQGRMCGPALQEVVAAHAARPVAQVGRLRGQAPVKPVALSATCESAP